MPIVEILGIEIDQVTFEGALDQIESFVEQRGQHQVVTVNPEFVMQAQHDAAFRRVLNQADLAVADGAGLLWASRVLGKRRLPERVTGTDLVPAVGQRAAQHGWKLYFLGGGLGNAERAAQSLKQRFPNLSVVGTEIGPLMNEQGKPLNKNQAALLEASLGRIQRAKPDILFVAFGAPKQDRFIARYRDQLKVPVMIGVGGAFEFLSGQVRRAPALLRALHLEWLWRLILDPRRIGRIFTAVVRFPLAVLTDRSGS